MITFKMIIVITLFLIYSMFILGGTVYLIGWKDWNVWWMILSISLLPNFDKNK